MPKVTINIPYEALEKIVRRYPDLPPEEALRVFIIESLSSPKEDKVVKHGIQTKTYASPISREDLMKLQRSIQDILNPYSAKVDSLARRLADVINILELLTEKVRSVEESIKKLQEQIQQVPSTIAKPTYAYHRERRERGRRSAVEILKDQKVMFESDIASKIKNRDAFFERLKRDGAVILELPNERVAVDPDFWEEFRRKVSQLTSNNDDEIAKELGSEGFNLLKALIHSAQAYYDATRRRWILLI